jgi:hypothetical protein
MAYIDVEVTTNVDEKSIETNGLCSSTRVGEGGGCDKKSVRMLIYVADAVCD